MVAKTIRRTLSGLTSAFSPDPKAKSKRRVEDTVKSAQQSADEAWRNMTHGVQSALLRKDPKT